MNQVTFSAYDNNQAQEALNLLAEEYNLGTTSQPYVSGRAVHIERSGNKVSIKSDYFAQHTLEASAAKVISDIGLSYCNKELSFID